MSVFRKSTVLARRVRGPVVVGARAPWRVGFALPDFSAIKAAADAIGNAPHTTTSTKPPSPLLPTPKAKQATATAEPDAGMSPNTKIAIGAGVVFAIVFAIVRFA